MKDHKPDWAQISRLLDQALDLPAPERLTWLESLGAEYETLKPQLRELLTCKATVETNTFLAPIGRLSIPPATTSGIDTETARELSAGCTLGGYRLLRVLGHGGMGAVWLAERTDGLIKRPVALKLPNVPLHVRGIAERFARERDILATLTHPNIAQLHDAGVDTSGQPFLALEYVEGEALLQHCDDKKLNVRARLNIFLQVLSAVQYAHSNLVLHRDLKPNNILVTEDGTVKLLDFGIAKLMTEGSAQETELTQLGGRALTLDYASPEQIMGLPLSTASDVYSLGVLLCELLAGERPYRLKRGTRAELEETILAADPTRPSALAHNDARAELRATTQAQLVRQLKGEIDSITLKALRKKPEDRYPSVATLTDDIQRHLRGDVVLAQPENRWYRAKKFAARNKLAIGAVASVVTALALGLGLAIWQAQLAARERDRAVNNAERAELLNGFLQSLIGGAGSMDSPVVMRDLLAKSEQWVTKTGGRDPTQQVTLLRSLAAIYNSLGHATKAHELLQRAKQLASQSEDAELNAVITCQAAYLSSLVTRNPTAKQEMTQALARLSDDPSAAALCLNYLAFIAQNEDDAKSAVQHSERALAELRRAARPQHQLEMTLRASLARSYYLDGDITRSDREFESVMQQFDATGMSDSPIAISARNNWAVLRIGTGDAKQALALYDQLIRDASARSPNGLAPVYAYANRARSLSLLGDTDAALAAYTFAHKLASELKLNQFVLYTAVGVAEAQLAQGDVGKAEEWLNQAKGLAGDKPGQKHPGAIALLMVESDLAMLRGQFEQARTLLTQVVDLLNDGRKPSSSVSVALRKRSQAALALGVVAQAADDAEASLTIARSIRGTNPHSYLIGNSLLAKACIAAASGDAIRAAALAEEASSHFVHAVGDTHPARRIAAELGANKIEKCPTRW